ncbi:MAG: type II secretion system F family protein [Actinobacteria bacterium]|nr:type II secretion system F family protein [Actinomycetota bacterium]
MTEPSALGALLGVVLSIGVLLMVARWRRLRRPRLVDRACANSSGVGQGGIRIESLRLIAELVAPILTALSPRSSTPASVETRLRSAGLPGDVTRFRLSQVVWLVGGFIVGGTLGSVIVVARSGSLVIVVALTGLGVVSAYLLQDWLLSGKAKRRGKRMGEQLPTVAELLAFAVAAGEPPLAALERVARTVDGELAAELDTVVSDVRVGGSISVALRDLASRTKSQAVGRFVDGIVVSLERGSPLAEVLRAQAADARAAGRRQLLESAGRREVAMLVPVVFLILPIVVVIALFPGVYGITLSIP